MLLFTSIPLNNSMFQKQLGLALNEKLYFSQATKNIT